MWRILEPYAEYTAFGSFVDYRVYRVDCTIESIVKIVDVFQLSLVLVTVEPISDPSVIIKKLSASCIEYRYFQHDGSTDGTVELLINTVSLIDLLPILLVEGVESLMLVEVDESFALGSFGSTGSYTSRDLVRRGLASQAMTAYIRERWISVDSRAHVNDTSDVLYQLKMLFNVPMNKGYPHIRY